MTFLRSLLFNLAFYLWTTVCCLLLAAALPLPRRVMVAGVRRYMQSLALLERVILGLGYRVVGREHVPAGPYILAAKHQSTWETMKLLLLADDPAIVLKRELMWIPLWGWFAAKAGMIPVNRGAGSSAVVALLAAARQRAAQGRPIVIFPQGTRTAPGTWRPYRVGIAALYEALELPVVPMALNSGVFWGRRQFLKRPGTVTVEYLPPIPPGLGRARMLARLEAELEAATDRLVVAAGGPPTVRPERGTAVKAAS